MNRKNSGTIFTDDARANKTNVSMYNVCQYA
jgi:hypothetical protein